MNPTTKIDFITTTNVQPPLLQRLGDAMQQHRLFIQGVQWFVVIFYFTLLIWPALLPMPKDYVHIYENLILFAQFIFWGIWWPFVMLSMVLVGRVWCGVFCPEGFLSEWSSHHGLGHSIPRWMRWGGWPFVAFILTTIYGQLISVYEYPKAALLILGGSTIVAMIIGFIYGQGKRVWCRHLCPANGVFSLLSRLAPIHFSVDQKKWNQAPHRTSAVNCAPLVSVRNMTGNSNCHMCGRCSSHRNAVTLKGRSVNKEIISISKNDANPWDIALLFLGLLGVATGAFQWSASPWFVSIKQRLAEWFIEHDSFWILNDDLPWWLLTHYPDTNDIFSYLDGFTILIYITANTLFIGGSLLFGLWLSGQLLKEKAIPWHLGYAFTPLAGISLFLGLTALTLSLLKAEHIHLMGIAEIRIALLTLAYLWSGYLLWQKIKLASKVTWVRQLMALATLLISSSFVALSWIMMFFIW